MALFGLLAVLGVGFNYARMVQETGRRAARGKLIQKRYARDRHDCRPVLESRTARSGGHDQRS